MVKENKELTIEDAIASVSPEALAFFGSKERVKEFIEQVADTGSPAGAAKKLKLVGMFADEVIAKDEVLSDIVKKARDYALDVAESVLYERAVHGYNEEVYDAEEHKVKSVKKYSDRALVDYLRANDPKYKTKSNGQVAGGHGKKDEKEIQLTLIKFDE